MNFRGFVIAACLVLVFSGVGLAEEPEPKLAKLIFGKWQSTYSLTIKAKDDDPKKDKTYVGKLFVVFHPDGTFEHIEEPIPDKDFPVKTGERMKGTYSFPSESVLEIAVKLDGKEHRSRAKITITGKVLVVTPVEKGEGRKAQKFTRVEKK